ncbi:MAG: hypothetical protein HY455_03245 [Parcubacteria group bacterium]|nr:hypothetical protein [Parcubacteria group bacterium]
MRVTCEFPLDRHELAREAKIMLRTLPWWKKVWYHLGRCISVGERKYEGWTGFLPFYFFKCPTCKKPSINYPNGYEGHLHCNHCPLFPSAARSQAQGVAA